MRSSEMPGSLRSSWKPVTPCEVPQSLKGGPVAGETHVAEVVFAADDVGEHRAAFFVAEVFFFWKKRER